MYLEPSFESVTDRLHWVCIKVETEERRELVEYLKWQGLTWAVRCKWAWYFRYRAALLQIKHPRHRVEMRWGNDPKPDAAQISHQNRIRARKAKITELENREWKARASWNQMFPIETHPAYQKHAARLQRLRRELAELQNQSD